MVFNHEIIDQAISRMKKTEYNLEDLYLKLKQIVSNINIKEKENPERYRQLQFILKETEKVKEEAKDYIQKLQRITVLYESYEREAVYLVDDLPVLIDNNVLSDWISNILIHGIENIKNEVNPMLCNHILQHEDWLINSMLETLGTND